MICLVLMCLQYEIRICNSFKIYVSDCFVGMYLNVSECIWIYMNASECTWMYLNVSECVWMHWFELVGRIQVSWASARLMNWPSNCSPILYSALVLFLQNIIIAVKYTHNMLIISKVYKFCCHFVATFIHIYSYFIVSWCKQTLRTLSVCTAQCMKYRIDPSGVFFSTYFGICQLSSSFDIYICHGTDKNPTINKLRMAVNKRVCQSTQYEQTQTYPLHQCVWVNSYQGGIRQESWHSTNTILWGSRVQVVELKQYKILLSSITGEQPVTSTKYIFKQQESLVLKHPAPVERFTKLY